MQSITTRNYIKYSLIPFQQVPHTHRHDRYWQARLVWRPSWHGPTSCSVSWIVSWLIKTLVKLGRQIAHDTRHFNFIQITPIRFQSKDNTIRLHITITSWYPSLIFQTKEGTRSPPLTACSPNTTQGLNDSDIYSRHRVLLSIEK